MIGRVYLEYGEPVIVRVQWGQKSRGETHGGPKNVLIERMDGALIVRPFRGLRRLRLRQQLAMPRQGAGLCECGCGLETNLASYSSNRLNYVKGQPVRFIHGHNRRKHFPEPPPKLCECGCGELAPVSEMNCAARGSVRGQRQRFVKGHQARGRIQGEEERAKRRGRNGPLSPKWKGGVLYREGRKTIWVGKDHPMAQITGYCFSHRLVMAEALGRMLTPVEMVHHLDQDKTNDDISNLLLVSKSQHARIHALIRKGVDPHEAAAMVCG